MMLRLSVFLFLTVSLFSCRDEFTLEGEYQDIPVAYAYLNADDDRHFVRVEKAFLESGGNANANAAIADSIYYGTSDATVVMLNGTTLQSIELERVNAEQFGLNREDGVFAQSPNILYTFRDSELRLSPGEKVSLTVSRPGQEDAVAETTLLRAIEVSRPNEMVRLDDYRRPLVMSWSKGDNARIYDVRVIFNIRELFPADASRNRDLALEWQLASAYVPTGDQESGNLVRFEVEPEAFYAFLGANLEPDEEIVRRFVDFDVRVSAAGQEVLDRRNLENANSGITSSQSLPRYTNLSGGIGILTSNTTTLKTGIDFDSNSRDSLLSGSYTRDLGFQ